MNNFKKSSFCSGGDCVEVSIGHSLVVVKDSEGDMVMYTHSEWSEFVKGVKNGEFDIKE